MSYEFIKEQFIKKHIEIDSEEFLDKYISLLINYKNKENVDYIEKHHILPRSTFPEYENESWNIVELEYEDHKTSHLWLFKAINIRAYQRPLNWMMNYYKNKEEISNAAKKGWMKLKKDREKYVSFCKNRSNNMKKLSSEEQRRRISKFWNNITDEQYLEFSNKMKNNWTKEKKLDKSNEMKEYYLNPENIIKKSIESKKIWESRTKEQREAFLEKMDLINKNEEKRKDASNKIKELWKDKKYLEKMKNRKKKPGIKLKLIYPNGNEIIYESMSDMNKALEVSNHLIRKYKDTNIPIIEKKLKNVNLIGCKIETIK